MSKICGFGLLLLFCGCGNLAVSPRSCVTSAIFGNEKLGLDQQKITNYYVLFNEKLEARYDRIIDCKKVKGLKITIDKKIFMKYVLTVDFKEEV